MTVLRTRRLTLRPKGPQDLDAMHALASEWEVVRWTATWPWPPDRAFTRTRAEQPPPERGMIAVIEQEGRVIGMGSAFAGELGYMLHPSAWGRGYAAEACAALLGHWFGTTDAPAIEAGVFEGNDASVRVLEKLGFRLVGRSPAFCRAQGRELPGLDFRLVRAAWASRSEA